MAMKSHPAAHIAKLVAAGVGGGLLAYSGTPTTASAAAGAGFGLILALLLLD